MNKEIKKCPFCDSEAHVTSRPRGFRVECKERFKKCKMNMRTSHHITKECAIDAWNDRPQR